MITKFINLRTIIQSKTWNFTRSMSIITKSLQFSEYGEPTDVLEMVEGKLGEPTGNQVVVKILAAPINPADINTIQGRYGIKPTFPATGGNEFIGEVVSVGDKVTGLSVGQRVVPYESGIGTWTTYKVICEDQLMKVPNNMSLAMGATFTVNPCTAYCMLKDFVNLKPGDIILQNGANSAVGQAVHQLCRAWGIKSIGIVRDRPDIVQLKECLKELGATEILTEEELRTTTLFKSGTFPKPQLAFNCVGGKSAAELTRHLAEKGILVTYGAMAREPVTATAAALIFKDISFRGFWLTRWTKEHRQSPERTQMFDELCELIERKKFVPPAHELVPLSNYKYAVECALNYKGFNGKKFILNMQCE